MKINQIRGFIAVVDYGSINKAAEKIFISQPSLSRLIQSLEDEIGNELLVRSNHGVSVTPTGRLVYYYGQSILRELDVLDSLKYLDEKVIYSKLSVSVSSIFLKDELILNCYQQLVAKETEIQVLETTNGEVFNHVKSSKSEIGIMILNNMQLSIFKKMAELNDIDITILDSGPIYIHMNEHDISADRNSIHFSELLDYTYIQLPSDFFSDLNNSIIIDDVQLSTFSKRLTMSNYHAKLNILKHTKSFMVGHKWQIDELKHSHIKSLLLENSDLEKYLLIIRRKNSVLSDAANIFIEIIKNNYACL